MMQTWVIEYSQKGDWIVLCEQKWWVLPMESIGVPLIKYNLTYRLGSFILKLADRGIADLHRITLPEELSNTSWRD